jgi:hypothetical protein
LEARKGFDDGEKKEDVGTTSRKRTTRTEGERDVARPEPHLGEEYSVVPLDQAVRDKVVEVTTGEFSDNDGDDGRSVDRGDDVRRVSVADGSGFTNFVQESGQYRAGEGKNSHSDNALKAVGCGSVST